MPFPFVTAVTNFGSPDRGYVGGVGFKFGNNSGLPVVITHLGRWVMNGNNQTHTLSIRNTSGTELASVSVNCAGATPGEFLYAALSSPYEVPAGGTIYVLSSETANGDYWYNNNNTVVSIVPLLGGIQSAYYNGSYLDAGNNGGTYTSAGPVSFQYSSPEVGWTKAGTTYTTDGSQYSVNTAIYDANPGDTVVVPPGTFTWSGVSVNKAVTLRGAGPQSTTINISGSAPTWSGGGAIEVSAPAIVADLTMTQPGTGPTTAIRATNVNGWRITNVTYNSAAVCAYFLYVNGVYGLVDNCTINGGSGSDEWIFTRGPSDSWQTASSMGAADAVYVEDCTFNNQGYPDFNANARGVIRFCTINATVNTIKLDAHGYATNTPARSCRHVEFYHNHWLQSNGSNAMELRGGTGMIFNNTCDTSPGAFYLLDYTYKTNQTNLGRYATPNDYPLIDQIGVGQDPKTAGSEPAYVWGNRKQASVWVRTLSDVAPEAIVAYGSTFAENDIIRANRDFFAEAGVDTDGTGLSIGTKAQMLAMTPGVTGYGFWVTDEGSWNTSSGVPSGRLYTWTGAAWIQKYEPYTYPHPLRGASQARASRMKRLARRLKLRGLSV